MQLKVSVLIVVRNEVNALKRCITSLLAQNIPREWFEILVIDGLSTDGTREIAASYADSYPELIRLVDNPRRTLAPGWNLGILLARAPVVVRLDAHAEAPPDFLARNLDVLAEHPEVMCVGGTLETRGEGLQGRTIALLQSSFFGVGNSAFRTGGTSGYVDTVAFGAYRKQAFEIVGLFDERLDRNQDLDLHRRMHEHGLKIWLDKRISCVYYSRSSLRGLVKQGFQNGFWAVRTIRSARARHLIPALFVGGQALVGVVALLTRSWAPLVALYGPYLLLALVSALQAAGKGYLRECLLLPAYGYAWHTVYGLGTWWAVLRHAAGALKSMGWVSWRNQKA